MSEHRAGGFTCPQCGARRDRVVASRGNRAGTVVRRRRHCDGCGRRWTTLERVDGEAPVLDVPQGRALVLAGQLRELAETLEAWVAIVKHD